MSSWDLDSGWFGFSHFGSVSLGAWDVLFPLVVGILVSFLDFLCVVVSSDLLSLGPLCFVCGVIVCPACVVCFSWRTLLAPLRV